MANLILPKYYRQQKPPLGSVIDYSNPLSKGLVGAWLMNEGGGSEVNDLFHIRNGVFTTPSWTKGGVHTDGSSSKINCGWDSRLQFISQLTIFTILAPDGDQGQYTRILNCPTAAAASYELSWYHNGITGNTATTPYAGYVTGTASFLARNYGSALTSGVFYTLCSTIDSNKEIGSGGVNNYLNGVLSNGNTIGSGVSNLYYDVNKNFWIATYAGSSHYGKQWIKCVYLWNRCLSPSEIQSLYIAPYQMIKPRTVMIGYGAAGEPPVTTSGTPYGFLSLNTGYW